MYSFHIYMSSSCLQYLDILSLYILLVSQHFKLVADRNIVLVLVGLNSVLVLLTFLCFLVLCLGTRRMEGRWWRRFCSKNYRFQNLTHTVCEDISSPAPIEVHSIITTRPVVFVSLGYQVTAAVQVVLANCYLVLHGWAVPQLSGCGICQ